MKQLTLAVVAAALMMLPVPGAAQSTDADKELEQAFHREVVKGDLKGAAEQYRRIAARYATRPEVAARALYQLGQCQEKLGQAEARKSYERVVTEYGGSGQYAAAAKARLTALGPGGVGGAAGSRLLWDNAAGNIWNVSADGRWTSFSDPATRDLVIRDLVTGQQRRVTSHGHVATGGVEGSIVSRDGNRIAYLSWDSTLPEGRRHQLRVIGADGTGERNLATLPKQEWFQPMDWSPDGKWIAGRLGYAGSAGWRIVLISTGDGQIREIVSRDSLRGSLPGRIGISPDGGWLAFGAPAADPAGERSVFVVSLSATRSEPMEVQTGAILLGWNIPGNGLLLGRWQESNWSFYLLPVADGKAAGTANRITVPTLPPNFYSLGASSTGSLLYSTESHPLEVALLQADLLSNRLGPITASQPAANFGWSLVGGGARWSPDGKRVLITKTFRQLIIRSLEDGAESTIELPMRATYRVEWSADGGSLLVAGEDRNGSKGLFRVDLRSGAATLIKADDGWAVSFAAFAPSPDNRSVYVRSPQGISVVNLATGDVRRNAYQDPGFQLSDMRFSRDGKQLALFGEGAVDILNVDTGEVRQLARTPGFYSGGDWSPDGQQLFSTWLPGKWDADLPTELVKLPISGGAGARTALGASYVGLRLSPDAKRASVTHRHPRKNQVWVLDNFLATALGR